MAEVIYIASARGGAGATTCAVRLGLALAGEGERTLILDGDCDFGSGLETCGLQGLNVYTLADVEVGGCRIKQAILQHPASPNLYILPTLGVKDQLSAERAVKQCEKLFDRILCDGAALGACSKAVLVSDPYPSSLARAKAKGAKLADTGLAQVKLLLNKVNGGLVFDGAILTPQEFASVARLPLLGVIPEDPYLPLGKIRKSTKKAFAMTASAVTGKSDKAYGVIKPYAGIKGAIRRKLRGCL